MYIFAILKNMWIAEMRMNDIHNFSTESKEEIRISESLFVEIAEGSFPAIICNF